MGFTKGRALRAAMTIGLLAAALPSAAPAQGPTDEQVRASARATGVSEAEARRILSDEGGRADRDGRLFYVDPEAPPSARRNAVPEPGPFPYSQTFFLHSRPSSTKKIYLDFTGHVIENTAWNGTFGSPSGPWLAEAFSLDEDRSTFTAIEQDLIQSVWQRVAEDYARFDVDVTTQDPGQAAITRTDGADQSFGSRALITDAPEIGDDCGCGGLAYVGVFNTTSSHARYQPAFTFAENLGSDAKNIAEATSHEVGHNLGLSHDGTGSVGYYGGHGAWAPIMGVGYDRPVVQWSKGEYSGANNTQDDLAVIGGHGLATLPDDIGNTMASALNLGSIGYADRAAKITTDGDVDVVRFDAAAGPVTFTANTAAVSANLDARLRLYNSSGTLLATANPAVAAVTPDTASGLAATLTSTLPSTGTYYLAVDGVGYGSAATTGYSGYASIGDYRLTGSWIRNGAPANDAFGGFVLTGTGGNGVASTAQATKESGEPAHAGHAGGRSIWLTWTAPSSGRLSVDTIGSSFDTLLAVYQGTAVNALTLRGASDNTPSTLQSSAALSVIQGQTYRIAIDGKAAAGGTVRYKWKLGLPNDAFAHSTPLSGASGSRTGSNVGATKETGEPDHAGSPGGRSVWFRWTAPATGPVTFRTRYSGFDTLLGVYTGSAVGALTEVASNDDAGAGDRSSVVTFAATAGVTYRIAIDGFSGATGGTNLSWAQ